MKIMNLSIKNVKIDGLFGRKNISWDLNDRVSVLVGKNGAGKSTILHAINLSIMVAQSELDDRDEYESYLAKRATKYNVSFSNNADILVEIYNTRQVFIDLGLSSSTFINSIDENDLTVSVIPTDELNSMPFRVVYIANQIVSSNANSISSDGDGIKRATIDYQIHKNIIDVCNSGGLFGEGIRDKLSKVYLILNKFLKDVGKEIYLDAKKPYNIKIRHLDNQQDIDFRLCSAGEKQLIYLFTKIMAEIADNEGKEIILLLDEPEISLHLSWQEMLIDCLLELKDDMQIIIATHSVALLMNGWMGSYTEIDSITTPYEGK